MARKALASIGEDYTSPNLSMCHGMAGIGTTYMEAYRVLRERLWFSKALRIGQHINSLGLRTSDDGVIWPVDDETADVGSLMAGNLGIVYFLTSLDPENYRGFPVLCA